MYWGVVSVNLLAHFLQLFLNVKKNGFHHSYICYPNIFYIPPLHMLILWASSSMFFFFRDLSTLVTYVLSLVQYNMKIIAITIIFTVLFGEILARIIVCSVGFLFVFVHSLFGSNLCLTLSATEIILFVCFFPCDLYTGRCLLFGKHIYHN